MPAKCLDLEHFMEILLEQSLSVLLEYTYRKNLARSTIAFPPSFVQNKTKKKIMTYESRSNSCRLLN